MKEIRVDSLSANQRLDKFLMKYFKAASSGFIYKMLRKKNIVLNGKKDTGKTILLEGDSIKVFFSDETFDKMRGLETSKSEYDHLKDINYSLDVIYEDDDIIACNKPAMMLSQKSNPDDISINEYILSYLINEKGYSLEEYRVFHPSVSNRLDYNTTGIILAAKTLQGQQKLSLALKNRTIDKFYIALVEGKLDNEITLNGTFTKDEDNNKVTIINDNSNNVITCISPIASNDNISLIKIHLITGKTHQIRAHLASISHPIIGDMKYAGDNAYKLHKEKYNVTSQMLHSYITEYDGIEIKAPVPDNMNRIIEEEYGYLEF